jgi:hypothetical protein
MVPTPNLDNPFHTRIPFELAISDKKYFGGAWKKLSKPQQTALKIAYGLPLVDDEEMRLWAAFQGFGVYDDLGFLLDVTYIPPYVAKEYDVINGLIGRRAGKSDRIGGLAAAYEITLGGHTAFTDRPDQPIFWLYIAQDLDTAKLNLKFVTSWIKESPVLSKLIEFEGEGEVRFKHGIVLRAEPPKLKTGRGAAVCGMTLDELAFWYSNSKSANPDFEVIRALQYATGQFPNSKQLRITTPWTKEGVAYLAWKNGTEGMKIACSACGPNRAHLCTHMQEDRDDLEGQLLLYSPTAAMGNPRMTRKRLARLRREDKEAFERESLAKFIDSQSSFLTFASVERAIEPDAGRHLENGAITREPIPGVDYVAAIDPAFRHDSFAFSIGHLDAKLGVVQDYVREWVPEVGERLDPKVVLTEIRDELVRWGLDLVYSDQYQIETLTALAEELNLSIIGVDFTTKSKPKMMQNMASMFNQGKVRLLNHQNQETQLKKLVKTVTGTYMNVAAPAGQHDDMAMDLALLITHAIQLPAVETAIASSANRPRYISEKDLQKIRDRFYAQSNVDDVVADNMKRLAFLEAFE